MRFLSLHIDGFGKLKDFDLKFADGLNIISGENEAGKTTLHVFIESMLYGPDKKPKGFSKSVHEAMEPWDKFAPYSGSLTIEKSGSTYRIERNFTKDEESLSIYDETAHAYLKAPEEFLKDALCGLSRNAFNNSVSIGQLNAKTGIQFVGELKKYVENVSSSLSPDINAEKAVEMLKSKKQALEKQLDPMAAKNYALSLSRIKIIEGELSKPENDNNITIFEDKGLNLSNDKSNKETELTRVRSSIDEATSRLKAEKIEGANTVNDYDEKLDGLYDDYKTLKSKRVGIIRSFAIIMFLLVMFSLAYGYYTRFNSFARSLLYVAVGAAVIEIIVFAVLIIINHVNLKKCSQQLEELLKEKIDRVKICDENIIDAKKANHSFDGIIEEREKGFRKRAELEEYIGRLDMDIKANDAILEEQEKIRYCVEGRLSEENRLRSQAALLRNVIADNNRIKEQIDAIDIAIDTINDLSLTLKDRIGTYLNKEASRSIKNLTNGHYRSMDIGTGNDIYLSTKDGMVNVNSVSAGTLDQTYLALRLAAARFMMGGQDNLPLLFDDSFALYDDDRLKGAVNFIAKDYGGQALVFTCHRREESALDPSDYHFLQL
ncbi:MAG: AAA family ATPase [Eubacteriales bacterium]|nr:AAA family ATPase [Eubacteriales bacterium]